MTRMCGTRGRWYILPWPMNLSQVRGCLEQTNALTDWLNICYAQHTGKAKQENIHRDKSYPREIIALHTRTKIRYFITHWPLGDVAVILKVSFSNLVCRLITFRDFFIFTFRIAFKLTSIPKVAIFTLFLFSTCYEITLEVNVTEPSRWQVNFGSGNDSLMFSGECHRSSLMKSQHWFM